MINFSQARAKAYSIFISVMFVLILCVITKPASALTPHPKVLVLNAYHQGEDWSDKEITGILTTLKKDYPYLVPSIEHLDTKRFPGPQYLPIIKEYLKNKYQGIQFDLIFTLDNSALNLMLKYRDELFPGVPIVFAGVNGYSPEMLKGVTDITGVVEFEDMEGTLRLALQIDPDIKTVLAVHDYTSSGFAVRKEMESVAGKFKEKVKVEYSSDGTADDLVAQIKALPKDAIVLLLTYVTDKNGRTFTREESTRLITSASPVPVYAMHETRLGYGIVGGMLLEGVEHGKQAAEIALRILSGKKIDSIKVAKSRSLPIFDYNQLVRFNIPINRLPSNAIIFNEPPSFWRQYRPVLIPVMVIIGFLSTILLILSISIVRIKRAEKKVRESEEKYRFLVENISDLVIKFDKNYRIIYVSPNYCETFGKSEKELIGNQFSNLINPEDVSSVEASLATLAYEPHTTYHEERAETVNGWRWVAWSATAIIDNEGKIKEIISIGRDIDDQKSSENAMQAIVESTVGLVGQNFFDTIVENICSWLGCDIALIGELKEGSTVRALAMQIDGKKIYDFSYPLRNTPCENVMNEGYCIYPDNVKDLFPEDKDLVELNAEGYVGTPLYDSMNKSIGILNAISRKKLHVGKKEIQGLNIIAARASGEIERKKSDDELSKQRHFLQKAQEIGKIGTWELDIQKNELLWTDENYSIFGLPIGTKLTYEIFLNCVYPEDRKYVDTEWKASFEGKPYDIEHRLLVDDKIKWVREKAELEFNSKGECVRGTGFTQDITDRKFSETALWESIERFKKIFDSQLDAIFVLNNEIPAIILECNQAVFNIFGYTSDELIGKTVNPLHIDDSHLRNFQDHLYSAIKKNGYLRNFEFSMKRKDGTLFPSEHTVLEMKTDSGDRIGWISIIRDLSEMLKTKSALVDSEHKFKILFENAPLSYQSLDENGNFIEVNQTWLNIMGYKREEVIGKNFSQFLHPDWQEHFKTNFPRFKAIGEILGVEFEMLKKDGTFILISFHGKIGHNPDGTFQQTHCVFRDITEQKRIEKEKNILEAQLQHAQKMEAIGTLAGGIAHDFNNILYPIIGFAEMLEEDLPHGSPEQKSIIEVLHAALRAKDLVKQILAFSRKADQEIKPIRLQSILQEAVKLIKSSIPATISIQTDIDYACGTVIADPSQMHQVIMNLTTNAYHAMQESGGQLQISLKQTVVESKAFGDSALLPGNYALLKFIDTGTGIKKEIMDKIFDPYFTTKELGKGTGLGLSVVQGIIKSCHGDIRVFSEPGKGTEVWIYLPIMKKLSEIDSPDLNEPIQGGTERILLVDDEEMIIKMEKQMLERLGYHVTTRNGSIEALEAFMANPEIFDLIISDMAMPKMTGVQLADKIKAVRSDLPVIICTGFSDQIDEETISKMGIQGYIMKPIIMREMAKAIREALKESKNG